MKSTDISWRSTIGNFASRAKYCHKLKNGMQGLSNYLEFGFILILLLVLAGVETNPGPTLYESITYEKVENIVSKSCIRSNNVQHDNSKWGEVSTLLCGVNDVICRKFIMKFHGFFQNTKWMKFSEVTPMIIIQSYTKLIDLPEVYSKNKKLKTSIWGKISNELFETNDYLDRQFVSSVIEIYLEAKKNNAVVILPQDAPAKKPQRSYKKKRNYNKKYWNSKKTLQKQGKKTEIQTNEDNNIIEMPNNIEMDNNIQPNGVSATSLNELIHGLKSEFKRSIWQFCTIACNICDQLMFPSLKKSVTVNENVRMAFRQIDTNYELPDKLITCSRCQAHLGRGKVPPKALVNRLNLTERPDVISNLSKAEVRLISQVKAYMKVFLSCEGKGQKAMRGMVIHFPQKVNEVITQLPLSPNNCDIIVVTETSDRALHDTELSINPKLVYEALVWLKENNHLYRNITINNEQQFDNFQTISLGKKNTNLEMSNLNNINNDAANLGYLSQGNGVYAIRASFCQSHSMFGDNAGNQCTAMCAQFLASAFVESPNLWTKTVLNEILLGGDKLYTLKRLVIENLHLSADEVVGTVMACGGRKVILELDYNNLLNLQGYLNNIKGTNYRRLTDVLATFIDLNLKFGIIITRDLSMGIYVDEEFVYFFDSHARGIKGCLAKCNGTAILLKIRKEFAPNKISKIIHRNCSLKSNKNNNIELFQFHINPFCIKNERECDSDSDNEIEGINQLVSNKSHISIDENLSQNENQSLSHERDLHLIISDVVPNFGTIRNGDCVIDREDFIEPDLDNVLNKRANLVRETGNPLSEFIEKCLEVLAFPNLFPYGINGLNQLRKIYITPLDYFQQRLMSSMRRFAGCTEYLFYALSECDKYRAQSKISVCCSMKKQGLSLDEVNELDIVDPHTYMSSIRGSSSYWKKYTGDVIAMIKQLGIPTFFYTYSYDDLNSDECVNALYKSQYGPDAPNIIANEIPYETRKQLLNDNPIAAARHFSMQLTKHISFLKKNSELIFGLKLKDFTVRVEFQARGSPHAHFLLWLDNAPNWDSEAGITFLERNVSCSLSTEYRDIVLKYQRHRHTTTCYKNNKNRCRFGFPKSESIETKILNDDEIIRNRGKFFELKRSKEELLINNYHPILLPILMCNMDIQPVTGEMAIAFYIAKYMSKSEPGEIRNEITDTIQSIQNSNLPSRQKMYKIAMTLMRNREISAQEAAFRICHLFLRQSSRKTIFLPVFQKENRIRMLKKQSLIESSPEFCNNIIDRYMARPIFLESICLYEFAANWSISTENDPNTEDIDLQEFREGDDEICELESTKFQLINNRGKNIGSIKKRKISAVIKYPNFDAISDRDSYLYSLIILYCPFRVENFLDNNVTVLDSFLNNKENFRNHSDDSVINIELSTNIDRALIRMMDFNEEERDNINLHEEFSLQCDERDNEEPVLAEDVFPTNAHPDLNLFNQVNEMINSLTVKQKEVFLTVKNMIENPNSEGNRLFVSGEGGTGKSYLIHLISLYVRSYFSYNSLLVCAPTGKAAFLLPSGITCHKAFSLSIELDKVGKYNKLGSKKLGELRQLYKNVKFIIIDEISMVNYETLRMIHLRLCEIFNNDKLFGGLSFLVFGDLLQLRACRGSPVFLKPKFFAGEIDLWHEFSFIELEINMRQIGNDPLLQICRNLRVGKLTSNDLEKLSSRLFGSKSNKQGIEECKSFFENALRIFPTLSECENYNIKKTKELKTKTRIYTINAHDTYTDGLHWGQKVEKSIIHAKESKTGGIPTQIDLGIGSRVMLRRNLNVRKGLVNGSTGVVKGFKWTIDPNNQLEEGDLPYAVIVHFDHMKDTEEIKCINVDFLGKKQIRVSRKMIPLILSYGVSIHKTQGSSYDKAVVDIGNSVFAKGMAYVAISRVRTLAGLGIIDIDPRKLLTTNKFTPFDNKAYNELERLRKTNK